MLHDRRSLNGSYIALNLADRESCMVLVGISADVAVMLEDGLREIC